MPIRTRSPISPCVSRFHHPACPLLFPFPIISSPAGAHRHHCGSAHRCHDPRGMAEHGAKTDWPSVEAEHTAGAEAEQPRQRQICWPMAERIATGVHILFSIEIWHHSSSSPPPTTILVHPQTCVAERRHTRATCSGPRGVEDTSSAGRGLRRRGGLLTGRP